MRLPRGRHNSRTRQIAMSALDNALLGGSVAGWSYRCGLHGRLKVTTHDIHVGKQLPRPLVLAFASDFHAGPSTHPGVFTALVGKVSEHRPDVLLLGGDYVSCKAEYVSVLADNLRQCDAPLGKYAVLGNHDLWTDDGHITLELQKAGAQVLINRSRTLPSPFDCVSVCGIDDPWTGSADAAETFRDAQPVRIFLTHSPDGLLLLDKEQFDVAFAGHTHGGQIALPGGTPIISAGGPLSRIYSRGRFDIAGHGPLIVSRGVGCGNIPVRINSDPELVMCTLLP